MRKVESDTSTTFHPDDNASPLEPKPQPDPTPAPPDEGGPADPRAVAALEQAFSELHPDALTAIKEIAAEAAAAGRSISVAQSATVRRWSIARTLIKAAQSPRTSFEPRSLIYYHDVLFGASVCLADVQQSLDPDQTLGALIGTFTIEQANALHDAFDTPIDGDQPTNTGATKQ